MKGSANIWMDPDALSLLCAICYRPFEAQVFMCKNGHAACGECRARINGKCWGCDEPFGDIRCRPLEKALDETNTLCEFSEYGCVEVVKYTDKRRHEATCPRTPSACPFDGCDYRAVSLYGHLLDEHAGAATRVAYLQTTTLALHESDPFRVLLLERDPGRVFVLLNANKASFLNGRRGMLSLVCLGPRPQVDGETTRYQMEVRRSELEAGELSLDAPAPCVRELEGFEKEACAIFVPKDLWGRSGSLSVSIRIGLWSQMPFPPDPAFSL
ncbi:unnamed protein product [Urochloa humidicola]